MRGKLSDPSEKLPGVDPILAFLVARVEEDRESGKITLFLSGSIITGTIIGAAEWHRLVTRPTDHVQGLIDEVSMSMSSSDEGDEADEEAVPEALFYHMKDARIITATGLIPPDGPGLTLRGRLNDVVAFSADTIVLRRRNP